MHPTLLSAAAIPESESTPAELIARICAIADEMDQRVEVPQPVDWEAVIDSGAGPGLALGAERRLRPR